MDPRPIPSGSDPAGSEPAPAPAPADSTPPPIPSSAADPAQGPVRADSTPVPEAKPLTDVRTPGRPPVVIESKIGSRLIPLPDPKPIPAPAPEQEPDSSYRDYPFLSPPDHDHPGDLGQLGQRYRVVKLLGLGGMGYVFEAFDENLKRKIALKVMLPNVAADQTNRTRFMKEARAAAGIKSDNVVVIYDVGQEKDIPYLAMEYLHGSNLDSWLKARKPPVPGTQMIEMAKGILKGLIAAHEKGLIHRDIKPANLWVEAGTDRIKLLDFGITRMSDANDGLTPIDENLTTPTQIMGTPAYMSPEQAQLKPVDHRADLFSVGVVLYQMLTGKSPFARNHPQVALFAVVVDPVQPAASLKAGIPDALAGLIDRLLSKNPDGRPATAVAALTEVEKIKQPATPPAAREDVLKIRKQSPPPGPGWAWSRSGALVLVLGAVVVMLGAVVVLAIGLSNQKPTEPTPYDRPPEKLPAPEPIDPFPDTPFLPGEIKEGFSYVREGDQVKGVRRVLKLDIGGGHSIEFVRIPKGSFMMGAPTGENGAEPDEQPQRNVVIKQDFFMGKFEVTQAQYLAVMRNNPSYFKGDNLPVESVTWYKAKEFCEQVSARTNRAVRLPSEAEWEYACRASTKTPFHFGSILNGEQAHCDGLEPFGIEHGGKIAQTTKEVGLLPPNLWGLYDMHGNVWEWCEDYYGPYSALKNQDDPIQLKSQLDDNRISRGGCWSSSAKKCRSAERSSTSPNVCDQYYGFRVCFRPN